MSGASGDLTFDWSLHVGDAPRAVDLSETGDTVTIDFTSSQTRNLSVTVEDAAGTDTTGVSVVVEESGPVPVDDADARPTDPDDDGLYEDVNGNERQDIADAVELFQHRSDLDPQYFDFNDSGEMEIGDAVALFRENT